MWGEIISIDAKRIAVFTAPESGLISMFNFELSM